MRTVSGEIASIRAVDLTECPRNQKSITNPPLQRRDFAFYRKRKDSSKIALNVDLQVVPPESKGLQE